jgi:hypothetical protein
MSEVASSAWVPAFAGMTVLELSVLMSGVRDFYSTAFTIDSTTFFASPNTIIVFGW